MDAENVRKEMAQEVVRCVYLRLLFHQPLTVSLPLSAIVLIYNQL